MSERERQAALTEIRRLMSEHDLSVADVAALDAAKDGHPATTAASILTRVLGYIGGAFIFSGIAAFVALQWPELNSVARVVITLGSGVALFLLALAAFADQRYRNAAVPFLLSAAVLEPVGMMVAFTEFGGGADERLAAILSSGSVAAQYLLTFIHYRRTSMLFVAILFASACWGLLLDEFEFEWRLTALTCGVAWLLLGVHFNRGRHSTIVAPLLFFGCWASLAGLFEMLEGEPYEVLFLAAACAMTWLGVQVRSRALNFASTVAILGYTAYFTGRHFAGSVGWPLALMLIGLLMILISALALRIDRHYLRAD